MSELITTLEKIEALPALLQSEADVILVSARGLSGGVAERAELDQLKEISAKITQAGKKAGIRANLILHEGSLETLTEVFSKLSGTEVSVIFFADPAVYMAAKEYGLTDRLVYDPETMMTSMNDAAWWLSLGIRGISVSPLLTLSETEEIASASGHAVVTVHGRTLMSRSHRQLLTAYGQAAGTEENLQNNRALRLVEAKRDGIMPVFEDETGTLIYSDDVLDSFPFIEKLLETHPAGLLVEGAFLGTEEQVEAVSAYRKILNGEDPIQVGKEYRGRYESEPFDTGYYEQKTVR